MSSDTSATLRLFIAFLLGIILIAAGLTGNLGSIIGSLVDAQDMEHAS